MCFSSNVHSFHNPRRSAGRELPAFIWKVNLERHNFFLFVLGFIISIFLPSPILTHLSSACHHLGHIPRSATPLTASALSFIPALFTQTIYWGSKGLTQRHTKKIIILWFYNSKSYFFSGAISKCCQAPPEPEDYFFFFHSHPAIQCWYSCVGRTGQHFSGTRCRAWSFRFDNTRTIIH